MTGKHLFKAYATFSTLRSTKKNVQVVCAKITPKKRLFKSIPADENFGIGKFFGMENGVLNQHIVSAEIPHYYGKAFSPAVFFYFFAFYKPDFSKTAAHSHYLFSRPPPALLT